jgi:hypothetical protein
MARKKQSTADPPSTPRRSRPRLFFARSPRSNAATMQAPRPKRKRTKATSAPGKRADACLASTAMTAKINEPPARTSVAEAGRGRTRALYH